MDNQSFVFNTRYLEVADAALTEYLRDLGFTLAGLLQDGFDPSVVKLTAEYSASAKLDDLIAVDTTCTRVGRSSFGMRFAIRRDERPLVLVRTVYVNVDAASHRARPLPGALVVALRREAGSSNAESAY